MPAAEAFFVLREIAGKLSAVRRFVDFDPSEMRRSKLIIGLL
jgi:hypothetical protein